MRPLIVLLSVSATASATVIATCSRNNCLREVIASNFPTRSPSKDCSSFLSATFTPATFTITVAPTTITSTLVPPPFSTQSPIPRRDVAPLGAPIIAERQVLVQPTHIPAYASGCAGVSAYSSACSCIGVTPITTTLPTPTTTTVVETATVTECASPDPTFFLQLSGSNLVLNGVPLDGTFAQIDTGDGPLIGFNGVGPDEAGYFSIASDFLEMIQIENFAFIFDTENFDVLLFADLVQLEVFNMAMPAICSIAGGVLACNAHGSTILQLCPGNAVTNDVWLGDMVNRPPFVTGCVVPTFNVVPQCTPAP